MAQKLSDKKRRISAAIEKVLFEQVQNLAVKENVNLTDIICDALRSYVAPSVKCNKDKKSKNAKNK